MYQLKYNRPILSPLKISLASWHPKAWSWFKFKYIFFLLLLPFLYINTFLPYWQHGNLLFCLQLYTAFQHFHQKLVKILALSRFQTFLFTESLFSDLPPEIKKNFWNEVFRPAFRCAQHPKCGQNTQHQV